MKNITLKLTDLELSVIQSALANYEPIDEFEGDTMHDIGKKISVAVDKAHK